MLFVLKTMDFFEFVPVVMIEGFVPIQIKYIEDYGFFMREIGL